MLLIRVLAVIALFCVALPASSQQTPAPTESIARLLVEWSKDLHDKRLDQIVMLYAPDAVFVPPNGERITGRPAIRELTKRAMDSFTSDLTFHSAGTEASGDLAYDSGEFAETLTSLADSSVSHGAGSYLMVFKRQPNGNWLIVQQVWVAATMGHP